MTDHAALAFDHWPAADRAAWLTAIQPEEFPDPGGPGAEWRAASRSSALGAYARWLGWLMSTGVVLDAEAPADRITPARIEAYIAFLAKGRATVTRASYFGVMCMTVRTMFPKGDWRWLQAIQRGLRRKSSPSRGKEQRIVPANQLRQLGLDLIERAGEVLDWPSEALPDRDRTAAARDFRDGLIIALLASRPLRVCNLLAIEIGSHLRQSGSRVTLHFERDETKAKRPIHTVWPVALEPALARYVSKVRPLLISARAPGKVRESPPAPGNALWVGQGGTVLTAGGLQKIFERRTRRRVGHVVNPHLFRDCVATTIADLDPDNIRHAAQLLGHRSLGVTERSYIAANMQFAVDRHHNLLSAIRSGGRKRCRSHRKDNE